MNCPKNIGERINSGCWNMKMDWENNLATVSIHSIKDLMIHYCIDLLHQTQGSFINNLSISFKEVGDAGT
ncbi:hypothetical protein P3S68_011508 [Capsicum galapagoense]